jgi:cytochrome c oxidase assembly protein subunit 15
LAEPIELEAIGQQLEDETPVITAGARWLVVGLLLLSFAQITIGTQVREQVDLVAAANGYAQRPAWVSQLGSVFESHRTLAALVVMANVVVGYWLWQLAAPAIRRLVALVGGLLILEMVAGIALAYFGLPAWLQPVHLTIATLLFGAQFLLLLALRRLAARTQPALAQVAALGR